MGELVAKAVIDKRLWKEALALDFAVYSAPLRSPEAPTSGNGELLGPSLISPRPHPRAFRLLPKALANLRRNKTAFEPLPDGSADTFAAVTEIAQSDLSFDKALSYLHFMGTADYLEEMLSPLSIVRLVQNGVKPEFIPGRFRTLTSGFEYGVFNSSHPDFIRTEMEALGERADLVAQQIKNHTNLEVGCNNLRVRLAETRFCSTSQVEGFTDRELLALLGASETQRIAAYIHPWYERIGRTTEEGRGVFALRSGVQPLYLSTSDNRSTLGGYERGVAIGITAVGVLRELGRRFGLSENQIDNIHNTSELYEQLPLGEIKKKVYKSPLRFVYGRNIFPDAKVMKSYYEETHNIVMNLIDTFDIPHLIRDPYSIYLTGQLIGRSSVPTNQFYGGQVLVSV